MVGMSFSNAEGEGWYVPVSHRMGEQIDRVHVLELVAPLFEDAKVPKAAHNANFDVMVLRQAGVDINNSAFDTMIAASLCGHNRIGLKDLALELYRAEMTPDYRPHRHRAKTDNDVRSRHRIGRTIRFCRRRFHLSTMATFRR